jgi:glycosyltransferase involved in cell wall biosynthesis
MPLVSVIIPCYNYARYLSECLESVLAQTVVPEEILVVDDGSTDNTREVAESFRERRVAYVHQQNQGLASARNTGIAHSSGEYLALLDADDVWHPRKIELQLDYLQHHRNLGALGTEMIHWPGTFPGVDAFPGTLPAAQVSLSELAVRNCFAASSMMLRRSAVEPMMPEVFDPKLRAVEDYDCWLRLAESWELGYLRRPLLGYRAQTSGLGSQPELMERSLREVRNKLQARGFWNRENVKPVQALSTAEFHRNCAVMYAAHNKQRTAIGHLVRSYLQHPSPITAPQSPARFRLLGMALLRLLGVRKSHGEEINRQ